MDKSAHRPPGAGEPPHRGHRTDRFVKVEGWIDYAVFAGIVLLAGAMVYGLLTTTGSAPWM